MDKCRFCDSTVSLGSVAGKTDCNSVLCPCCGDYIITRSAWASDVKNHATDEERLLFSGYIRNASNIGKPIEIDSHTYQEIKNIVLPYKRLSIDEKIDLVVRFIAENTKQIGNPVKITNTFTTFFLRNQGEVNALVDWMDKLGLAKWHGRGSSAALDIEGWRRYQKLKEINVNSKKVFVAMNFKKELEYIYIEGIEPACSECEFDAIRVDRIEHNQKICDKIIAEIKSSRFLIADFTEQRYGVYFEAGYAYGLGLPVIWACKKGEEGELHFDTRQYNYIVWENPKELKQKLVNRINATIK